MTPALSEKSREETDFDLDVRLQPLAGHDAAERPE